MTAAKPEMMPSAKRPYVAPVLERIDLAVNTQSGFISGTADGGAPSNSYKLSS